MIFVREIDVYRPISASVKAMVVTVESEDAY